MKIIIAILCLFYFVFFGCSDLQKDKKEIEVLQNSKWKVIELDKGDSFNTGDEYFPVGDWFSMETLEKDRDSLQQVVDSLQKVINRFPRPMNVDDWFDPKCKACQRALKLTEDFKK